MKREDLLDNLVASRDRHETVTLTLHPLAGRREDLVVTGRIIAIGRHYTGRRSLQVVFQQRVDENGGAVPDIIGLTMIKRFSVGIRP